jgi:outer membrane receptor protein involved in Fe transport
MRPELGLLALYLALGASALASAAAAQTTGTIRGLARDQEGAVVPGVAVTARSESRGTSRTSITSEQGYFVLASLPVDTYVVSADLDGFKTQQVAGVRVGISSTVTLELTMVVDSVQESITVAAAPLLDVTSSSVGTSYSSEFIEDLPTKRNFYDMMAVAPGISPEAEGSVNLSAFGSSIASNSWSIDGQDATNADTGNAWWYINPATIEEIQVLAIGAPAQYGNMSGAALNVVTKSGTNELQGSADLYFQDPSWTTENARINGIGYNRDQFRNLTLTLGGPLRRDRMWFFLAYENARDSFSQAGEDPAFPDTYPSDRYDLKVTAALDDSNLLEGKYHYEDYKWALGDAFATPDAQGSEVGSNPAWGIQLQSVLGSDNLLEVRYAGYKGTDDWLSRTGSMAAPFIDYSPPDGGPARISGSLWYPYIFDLSRDQVDVTLSHHADDFLAGDHDFKFGVSYGKGEGDTTTAGGPNGVYFYRYEYSYEYYGQTYSFPYYYRVTARPYHYGAVAESISAFVDDSWQVTPDLTLNLGLRLDRNTADIPDYPLLTQDWTPTGDSIPGLRDAVDWTLWSPRLGLAYQIGERSVLRAFYGKFYDGNVTGNWYAPPPNAPSYLYEVSSSLDGPWEPFFLLEQSGTTVDPDLKAPETDQFTLGFEQRIGNELTLGLQAIYKESKNLIGFEIMDDGVYEMVPWTNPFTGEVVELASIVEQPSIRKGNGPGPGSLAPPGTRFHQEYKGAVVVVNKRYADSWSLQGSYTWSDSEGFLPRPLAQDQGSPFYASKEGRDPNNWINADQALQNEREHVLQLQTHVDLPWQLQASLVYSYLGGKPFGRQLQVGAGSSASPLNQGTQTVIALPAGSARLPDQNVLDLALGRTFSLGSAELETNVQVFNVFNDDAHDWWQSLVVNPDERFVPSGFVAPRRWMVRLGLSF